MVAHKRKKPIISDRLAPLTDERCNYNAMIEYVRGAQVHKATEMSPFLLSISGLSFASFNQTLKLKIF